VVLGSREDFEADAVGAREAAVSDLAAAIAERAEQGELAPEQRWWWRLFGVVLICAVLVVYKNQLASVWDDRGSGGQGGTHKMEYIL
jgi:hypothetical protein